MIFEKKLELVVYYKSKLTSQLIMTNNNENKNMLNSTNVVYQSSARTKTCMLREMNYIGSTISGNRGPLNIVLITEDP